MPVIGDMITVIGLVASYPAATEAVLAVIGSNIVGYWLWGVVFAAP